MHCMHCDGLVQGPSDDRSIGRHDALRCRPVCAGEAGLETCFDAGDVVVVLGEPDGLAAAEIRLLQGSK